ncbi:hypothetical protein ACWIUD_11865 [Helicobacter sp. 23-1044]
MAKPQRSNPSIRFFTNRRISHEKIHRFCKIYLDSTFFAQFAELPK